MTEGILIYMIACPLDLLSRASFEEDAVRSVWSCTYKFQCLIGFRNGEECFGSSCLLSGNYLLFELVPFVLWARDKRGNYLLLEGHITIWHFFINLKIEPDSLFVQCCVAPV